MTGGTVRIIQAKDFSSAKLSIVAINKLNLLIVLTMDTLCRDIYTLIFEQLLQIGQKRETYIAAKKQRAYAMANQKKHKRHRWQKLHPDSFAIKWLRDLKHVSKFWRTAVNKFLWKMFIPAMEIEKNLRINYDRYVAQTDKFREPTSNRIPVPTTNEELLIEWKKYLWNDKVSLVHFHCFRKNDFIKN
jgi:hypothetical protein